MTLIISTEDVRSAIFHQKINGVLFTFCKGTELKIENPENIKNQIAKIETIAKKKRSKAIFFPMVVNPIFAGCLTYMGYENKKIVTVQGSKVETEDENSYVKVI